MNTGDVWQKSQWSALEAMREKAVLRAPETQPSKPISGGADFSPWVK